MDLEGEASREGLRTLALAMTFSHSSAGVENQLLALLFNLIIQMDFRKQNLDIQVMLPRVEKMCQTRSRGGSSSSRMAPTSPFSAATTEAELINTVASTAAASAVPASLTLEDAATLNGRTISQTQRRRTLPVHQNR